MKDRSVTSGNIIDWYNRSSGSHFSRKKTLPLGFQASLRIRRKNYFKDSFLDGSFLEYSLVFFAHSTLITYSRCMANSGHALDTWRFVF